ncbi:phosphate ABC transporter permease subunit PstC [Haladaptatus salinisoli]|uniref:phosphate ABC transporter permease subunit PstC n=1 Tax=Haladaptatus salinisoli TaxID=2884876 RepID=UPI001D0B978C|nr:phosphate ABC transporter permease subunit PstC [Haladaptatus salinisoli]
MGADRITQDLTRRTGNSSQEVLAWAFFFTCALLSILTTIGIALLLINESLRFFSETAGLLGVSGETASLMEFLTGTTWRPSNHQFGVLAPLTGTLMVTIGSAIIALPLGVATALYLSEYASKRARSVLKPALEILAGVPTVIYGFFALVYITPLLEPIFHVSFFNMMSASIVVGIMIIPMVASISEDAMSAVPDELRQAGYGMGATKLDVSIGIVIPAAISGIFSSFILALSRAIGETMAVTVAAGSVAFFRNPFNPFAFTKPNMPMTAAIVNSLTGDFAGGGIAYRSAFAVGLTLFVITLLMNVVSDLIAERYREEY